MKAAPELIVDPAIGHRIECQDEKAQCVCIAPRSVLRQHELEYRRLRKFGGLTTRAQTPVFLIEALENRSARFLAPCGAVDRRSAGNRFGLVLTQHRDEALSTFAQPIGLFFPLVVNALQDAGKS